MTETTTVEPATALIDDYFEMWRATDADTRRDLVERCFVADGRHVDPHADVTGHDDVAAMLAGVHEAYAGFAIERTSGIDRHGDQVRYSWRLDTADGATLVAGIDVVELAADGRMAKVIGFWGDLPTE